MNTFKITDFGYYQTGSSNVRIAKQGAKSFYFATAIRGEGFMYYKGPSRRYITVKGKKHFRAVQRISYASIPKEVKALLNVWHLVYRRVEAQNV